MSSYFISLYFEVGAILTINKGYFIIPNCSGRAQCKETFIQILGHNFGHQAFLAKTFHVLPSQEPYIILQCSMWLSVWIYSQDHKYWNGDKNVTLSFIKSSPGYSYNIFLGKQNANAFSFCPDTFEPIKNQQIILRSCWWCDLDVNTKLQMRVCTSSSYKLFDCNLEKCR